MTFTTLEDFRAYRGHALTTEQETRVVNQFLPWAEDEVAALTGGASFYVPGDTTHTALATRDWVRAVCIVAEYYLVIDPEDVKEDLVGPYKSERIADYAYTLKDRGVDLNADRRLMQIIARNRPISITSIPTVFTAVGPAHYRAEGTDL